MSSLIQHVQEIIGWKEWLSYVSSVFKNLNLEIVTKEVDDDR